MTKQISNGQNVIDSRDIIARINELESQFSERLEAHEGKARNLIEATEEVPDDFDELEELMHLQELAEEASGYASDWQYGEALIRRSYWVEYVEDMLKDIGDLPQNIPHYIEIDWQKTADNIEADYTTVDYGGVEYLIRSC